MKKYRTKSVIVEAEQYDKQRHIKEGYVPEGVQKNERIDDCGCPYEGIPRCLTSRGNLTLCDGDWVVKESNGEYRLLKPDVFEEMFRPVFQHLGEDDLSEVKRLDIAVDEFTAAIKDRLISKYKRGWRGWDGAIMNFNADKRLLKNATVGIVKKDSTSFIDVAAYAMMFWRAINKNMLEYNIGKVTLGHRLKLAREELEFSTRDVERVTGISNSYLSQLETGKIKEPSFRVMMKLIKLYNLEANYFDGL
jgi:DNA-binding XRE family transcriptional regulator